MQLWPELLWPKPKARQPTQYNGSRNLHLQIVTRTFSTPATAATITTTVLYTCVISALLLITTAWGLTATQQPTGNYEGVSTNVDVVSALTGLSNGYAASNYIKNYYQVSEAEASKQQQQHEHQSNAVTAALKLGQQEDLGATGIIGRGFVGLQPNNYGNAIVTPGASVGMEESAAPFNVYDSGFVPTTFTAAGQHYAASLVGLPTATDKTNILHQFATTATYKNNLNANHQPYGNVNTNSHSNNNNNDIAAEVDSKAHHSLFRRLSNYDGLHSGGGDVVDTRDPNLNVASNDNGGDSVAGTDADGVLQNYALTYTDDAQQSPMLQHFYNQQPPFNDDQSRQGQAFANYFPESIAATAGYKVENQQKYYTLNNYQQTTKPPQLFEQQHYLQYGQQQPYEIQHQQQQQSFTATPAPAVYYQTYIQHKTDNKQNRHGHRHVQAEDNFHRWTKNQIMANYQQKQSQEEQQQQHQHQHQHQIQQNNQYHKDQLQEPETAETSHSARIKKSPKHKSKRHDNYEVTEHNYDTPLEQNDNTIEHIPDELSTIQIQQLEKLQRQLQQQQQQFIELQHQLIDHDQQLQIQKHVPNSITPTLPPITQTVHHNPHSLQAFSGAPLAKHTQIIKTVPIPQITQVHIPYRENVSIEVPDPVITAIRKPFPIQIPVASTVTVPRVQELKIPIEKLRPFPVERPIPYIVERRVPYTVEKQIAQPVYYPVPIKVPILHTIIHKMHKPPGSQHRHQPSYNLPHTVYQRSHGHGHGHSSYY